MCVCVCMRYMCACARARVRACVHILLIDCTENILKFCIIKNFCFINILLSVCTHYGL